MEIINAETYSSSEWGKFMFNYVHEDDTEVEIEAGQKKRDSVIHAAVDPARSKNIIRVQIPKSFDDIFWSPTSQWTRSSP